MTTADEPSEWAPDDALEAVMRTTRSMRRLRPDPVPRELLIDLVESATWAPTGGNAQSYWWVVVTEPARMAALATLWSRCHALSMALVEQVHHDAANEGRTRRMHQAIGYQRDHFARTPAALVACYDSATVRARARSRWRDTARALRGLGVGEVVRAAPHVRRFAALTDAASIYPAVQNVLLRARARGLAATMTTWHLLVEPEFKAVLDIPPWIDTFAVIPVGWPMGRFGPVSRRAATDAIRWQSWNTR